MINWRKQDLTSTQYLLGKLKKLWQYIDHWLYPWKLCKGRLQVAIIRKVIHLLDVLRRNKKSSNLFNEMRPISRIFFS